jgi:hypothetical protein
VDATFRLSCAPRGEEASRNSIRARWRQRTRLLLLSNLLKVINTGNRGVELARHLRPKVCEVHLGPDLEEDGVGPRSGTLPTVYLAVRKAAGAFAPLNPGLIQGSDLLCSGDAPSEHCYLIPPERQQVFRTGRTRAQCL